MLGLALLFMGIDKIHKLLVWGETRVLWIKGLHGLFGLIWGILVIYEPKSLSWESHECVMLWCVIVIFERNTIC